MRGTGWRDPARRIVRCTLATAALALVAAAAGAGADDPGGAASSAAAPPENVVFPGRVGEVTFPHSMHVDDLGIDCVDCHHAVTAPKLDTPHPQYFKECQIPCSTCHGASEQPSTTHTCTACHLDSGARQHKMLSAKVALHQMCSGCHEIGTGKKASQSCSTCHSGPRTPW